jgi:hypothetical protein
MAETLLWHLLTGLTVLVPEYSGRDPRALLMEEGAAQIIQRVAAVDPELLGRQYLLVVLSLQLSRYAISLGAMPAPIERGQPLLPALLDPIQRRAARRVLRQMSSDLGLAQVHVDFAAMWITDTVPPVRRQGTPKVELSELAPRDFAVVAALFLLVFACDCWQVGQNPLDVIYLGLINIGVAIWDGGAEEFKSALAEGLVAATSDIFTDEQLAAPDTVDWAGLMTGETLDWAGSVLLAFMKMSRTSRPASFRLLDFLAELELKARAGHRLEPVDVHLRKLGRRVLNLDAGPHSIPAGSDEIQRIPELHDLKRELANVKLTKRERQVFALKAQDWDYRAIGNELGIAPTTARVLMLRARRAVGRHQGGTRKKRG